MIIERVNSQDLDEILKLQYLAYQKEAKLVNNDKIQPLTQTLDQLIEEHKKGVIYKTADDKGKIIGSVRTFIEGEIVHIGKLMVHPEYQHQGIGTKLLQFIDREYPQYIRELFTSDKSKDNIRLYERMGYVQYKAETISNELHLIYLQKKIHVN